MPIVIVELVAEENHAQVPNLAQPLADAIGRALNSPPGQTWVRLRIIRRDEYAENESVVDSDELPVFITLLKREAPCGAELQAEVVALTHAIVKVVGRPASCVHIVYAPAAAGRVSFGGKLVE